MKNLLNQFIRIVNDSEEFERELNKYERVKKTDEWKFVRDVLLIIKSTILQDMFSARFTNLDEKEKDIEQRTYYNINELMDFLMNPSAWIKLKKTRFAALANLAGKVKPNPGKEKQ